MSELDAACLLKIWTGSVMCGHNRAQMFGGSAACPCGEQEQTWGHVLWHCPTIPPPPANLLHLSRLPPAFSTSLILPWGATPAETSLWRQACIRALDVMKRMNHLSERFPEAPDRTSRGHYGMHTSHGRYIYCARCYVTRRAKDRRWLVIKSPRIVTESPALKGKPLLLVDIMPLST